MVRLSIIVPIYNVENYLRQCLDSVVNQTLKDIEIICINDGSTDNSLKILKEYSKKDSRITVINQKNHEEENNITMDLGQCEEILKKVIIYQKMHHYI